MTSRLIATSRCTARSPRHTSSPSSTASLRSLLTRSYATPSPQPRPKPTPYIPTSPDAFPRFGTTFIALPLPAQIYTQPFQFSPSTALRRLNYAAIKHTAFLKKDMRPPMLGFAWLRSLKALWNAYVMGNKPKMLGMKAVYLPGWKVDCWLSARLRLPGNVDETLDFRIDRMFFPGTITPMLRDLSFSHVFDRRESIIEKFDPAKHGRQYKTDVSVIPFDSSPLVVPELIRKQFKTIPIPVDDTSLSPTKDVSVDDLLALPLYLPIYVINYEYEGETFSMVIGANDPYDKDISVSAPGKFEDLKWPWKSMAGTTDRMTSIAPSTIRPKGQYQPLVQPPTLEVDAITSQQVFISPTTSERYENNTHVVCRTGLAVSQASQRKNKGNPGAIRLHGLRRTLMDVFDRWLDEPGVREEIRRRSVWGTFGGGNQAERENPEGFKLEGIIRRVRKH